MSGLVGLSAVQARPRGIDALLESTAIAVVGASDRLGSPGSRVMAILQASGYAGEIVAINPRLPHFEAAITRAALEDCEPGSIDHVLVLTPAATVPDLLRSCVELGVGAVTLLSAGFDEDGDELAETFAAIVGGSGLRILGPNCLGAVNAHTGLVVSPASAFMSGAGRPGPVSIVSQSGAVGAYLVGLLDEAGLGVRYFVSTGNETDLKLGELAMHYARDPQTEVLVVYLEGLRDAPAFIEAVEEARTRGKNVVVLKAGDTEVGAAAVRSHTSALAGDDAAYDAAFERLGVYRARSLTEAVRAVRAAIAPQRTEHRVRRTAVVTSSGGLGILAAEAMVHEGFELPAVPEAAQARMRELRPLGTPSNPFDLGGAVPDEPGAFLELLELMVSSLELDALVMVASNLPRSPSAWPGIRQTLRTFAEQTRVTLAVVGALSSEDAAMFAALGVITSADPVEAAHELTVRDRVTAQRQSRGTVARRRALPDHTGELAALDDLRAMELLAAHGVPFPSYVVEELSTGVRHGGSPALPVAVKLLQPGVIHKAAAGNVVVGIDDRDELELLLDRYRDKASGQGHLLVQTMVGGVFAEVIVSARRDETFGPMYVVGTGGRDVELLADRAILLEPVSLADVTAALSSLRFLADLGGDSGTDLDRYACEVAEVVYALQKVLENEPDVCEIEINPVVLRREAPFAIAVDAVVLTRATTRES